MQGCVLNETHVEICVTSLVTSRLEDTYLQLTQSNSVVLSITQLWPQDFIVVFLINVVNGALSLHIELQSTSI